MHADEPESIRAMLECGADINARDNDGQTALMNANDEDCIKVLIEAGADVNAKDNDGWTPLMHLYHEGPEIIEMLIKAGADVNARDNDGETVLGYLGEYLNDPPEDVDDEKKVRELLKKAGAIK